MRVGIFGGSFSPVHNGHLRLAQAALSELNLDRVIFVPTHRTPLKEKTRLLPDAVRVRLLKRALKGRPGFELSLFEISKKGVSYTVETLEHFKRVFGEKAALYFLAGGDTLKSIGRWRSFDRILKLCRFVVMTRPGHPVKKAPKGVLFLPFDALDVSSSEIRNRLKKRLDVEAMAPPGTVRALRRLAVK